MLQGTPSIGRSERSGAEANMAPKVDCSRQRWLPYSSYTCTRFLSGSRTRSFSGIALRTSIAACLGLIAAAAWMAAPAKADDKKLTDDDRIEILRGIMAEYANVKIILPRSPKPLPFSSDGTWDKEAWAEAGQKYGPAARVGDQVQITKVTIEGDKILLQINGGTKSHGNWRDHVQVGMGGATRPISTQQNTSAPGGSNIALLFHKPIPEVKAAEIKKMLAPILD